MAKRSILGSRAIVTGASSGIGKEIALELCRQGGLVAIAARREDRLQAVARQADGLGGRIIAVGGDISLEEARKRLLDHALAEFGGLDILVNNAGIGATGLFTSAGPERLRQLMEVNFFALAEMTRLAIPHLRRGTRPIVVNLSSILGRRGVPHNSEYCASKFAVHGFSEAIRTELAGEGIDVLVVSPGTTETEFFDRVIDRSSEPAWPEHRPVTAAYVAKRTVAAMRAGKREIIPYFWGRLLCAMNRVSPGLVDRIMRRYV
ncbi:MAG: SDR family NAD(P)-dependent oxidoreductase [Pirellulales bacterium]|nr:SDR family NAD(P)-dependent oxidoreductase [Pirellulales bacterium]